MKDMIHGAPSVVCCVVIHFGINVIDSLTKLNVGDWALEPFVAALKKDDNGGLRYAAVEGLAALKDTRATEPLIALLCEDDVWTRYLPTRFASTMARCDSRCLDMSRKTDLAWVLTSYLRRRRSICAMRTLTFLIRS